MYIANFVNRLEQFGYVCYDLILTDDAGINPIFRQSIKLLVSQDTVAKRQQITDAVINFALEEIQKNNIKLELYNKLAESIEEITYKLVIKGITLTRINNIVTTLLGPINEVPIDKPLFLSNLVFLYPSLFHYP